MTLARGQHDPRRTIHRILAILAMVCAVLLAPTATHALTPPPILQPLGSTNSPPPPTPFPGVLTVSQPPPAGLLGPLSPAPGDNQESFFQLPRVYVTNIFVEKIADDGIVTGSFAILNREASVQSDLRYQFQLLGTLPPIKPGGWQADSAPQYDRTVSAEILTALPGQSKDVPFRYQAPRVPVGDYRLRIRLLTSQARELGWYDQVVRLGTPGVPFVILEPGPLLLPDGSTATPLQGPNVDAGKLVTLQGFANNDGRAPVTVVPHVAVYRWNMTGRLVEEKTFEARTIRPKERVTLEIPVSAGTTPDSYYVVLNFQDVEGTRLSNQLTYRFVVKGVSAKVVTAAFAQVATKRGAEAIISAALVGSADYMSPLRATTTVELLDGKTAVAAEDLVLTLDGKVQPITARLILPRDIANPGFRITIRAEDGAELDRYEAQTNLTPNELRAVAHDAPARPTAPVGRGTLWIVAGLIVLLLMLLLVLVVRRHATPSILILLMLIGSMFSFAFSQDARASHVVYKDGWAHWITVFVNSPIDYDSYDSRSVPLSADITVAASTNSWTELEVWASYGTQEGHYFTYDFPGRTTPTSWRFGPYTCPSGGTCTIPINGISTTVNVGSIPTTTIQFDGRVTIHFGSGPATAREVRNTPIYLPLPDLAVPAVSVRQYDQAFRYDQLLELTMHSAGYYTNWSGLNGQVPLNEKWLINQALTQWYFILPDGKFHQYTDDMATSPLVTTFSPTIYENPALLHDAPVPASVSPSTDGYDQAFRYDQLLELTMHSAGYYTNWSKSLNEKWLINQALTQWYFILPNGEFHRWTGVMETSPLVTTFSPTIYENPALLHEAPEPAAVSFSTIAGQDYILYGLTQNLGGLPAEASRTGFTMTGEPVGSVGVGSLPIAGTQDTGVLWTATTPGTYTLVVCADVTNAVVESNEGNNCATTTITVSVPPSPPPPSPSPLPTSPSPLPTSPLPIPLPPVRELPP